MKRLKDTIKHFVRENVDEHEDDEALIKATIKFVIQSKAGELCKDYGIISDYLKFKYIKSPEETNKIIGYIYEFKIARGIKESGSRRGFSHHKKALRGK